MYEYLDNNIIKVKQNIKAYIHNSRLGLMKYDELNVGRIETEVDELFNKIDNQSSRFIEGEIKSVAKKYGFSPTDFSVEEIFSIYNPTTLYVYKYEMERKKQRYKENILSSLIGSGGEIKVGKKLGNRNILVSDKTTNMNEYDTKNSKVNVDEKDKSLSLLSFPKKIMALALLAIPFLNATKSLANNINRQIEETAIEGERYMFTENGKRKGEKYVRWVSEHDERVCSECEERDGRIYSIDAIPPRPHHNCRCELEYATEEEYEEQ